MHQIESHPFAPFIPDGTKVVLMGTFPPRSHRWRMEFFYPNPSNDFWKVFGLIFFGDPLALYDPVAKSFRLDDIKALLTERRIAIVPSALKVRRLQGNAADKHLEIVEAVDLAAMLARMPQCRAIATTGEKAAQVIAHQTNTKIPPIGQPLTLENGLQIWRLPSTSRAYPLPLTQKAERYADFFRACGII